ncbi:DUF2776 family protein [Kitasatospora sp. MY 5-36]|uniref:DUF2776 family protein n=1 Tax=Kitasatospora sp. MY 5-36 TaxID=1678027 RepID=UPI0006709909|nr:DUF2776 family protein [Kitasatospora sp. MY 5-36]
MNHGMSVLLRAIPLLMGAVSAALGGYVLAHSTGPSARVAGLTLVFLAAVCLCLFAVAATVVRQLIGRFGALDRIGYPAFGFAVAGAAVGYGLGLLAESHRPVADFVAGSVVLGIGLVCVCVSSVAAVATRFTLIGQNAVLPEGSPPRSPAPFGRSAARALVAVPVLAAAAAWAWATVMLANGGGGDSDGRFTAGHVVVDQAIVCTALIGLVITLLRQIRNTYTRRERVWWLVPAAVLGAMDITGGLVVVALDPRPGQLATGYVQIGLGLLCWTVLSAVLLLALGWRRAAPPAGRVPLVPVGTTLLCLFMSAFLFESADPDVTVAARVLVGLGAVCFSLFAVVSVLEAGVADRN